MKLSRIKEIIREEYYNVMNEGFADPEIRKLARLGGLEAGKWTNFFRSFAKTHDIAWDKLPKGTLIKTAQMDDPRIKDGLAFWVIEDDKKNPYGGDRYFDQIIRKGVMAVTLQGRPQYYSGQGMGAKGGYKQGQAAGRGVRGTLQLKKLKELADYVYVMDFESFRGGTKALKADRAELKLGKDTFKDARAWKDANEAITTGMEVTKVGKYGDLVTTINGNEVNINSVTNAMSRVLRTYAEYIRFENDEARDTYSKDFYKGRKEDAAGQINKALKAFKSGNARQIDYI